MADPPVAQKDPATDADAQWLKLPAVYCDTWTILAMPENKMVRIVFGDFVSPEHVPFYRTAVMIPATELKNLIELLTGRLKEIEGEAQEPNQEVPSDSTRPR